jgi:hypothetical protein
LPLSKLLEDVRTGVLPAPSVSPSEVVLFRRRCAQECTFDVIPRWPATTTRGRIVDLGLLPSQKYRTPSSSKAYLRLVIEPQEGMGHKYNSLFATFRSSWRAYITAFFCPRASHLRLPCLERPCPTFSLNSLHKQRQYHHIARGPE